MYYLWEMPYLFKSCFALRTLGPVHTAWQRFFVVTKGFHCNQRMHSHSHHDVIDEWIPHSFIATATATKTNWCRCLTVWIDLFTVHSHWPRLMIRENAFWENGLRIHYREFCLDMSDQVPADLPTEPEGFSPRARLAGQRARGLTWSKEGSRWWI